MDGSTWGQPQLPTQALHDVSDVVKGSVLAQNDLPLTVQGQMIMVSKSMVEYVTCKKCKKKCDGDKTGDLVLCNTIVRGKF